MNKRTVFLLAMSCVCLAAGTAQTQETGFAERLKTVSAATRTIECDFTLTKTMEFMASDVVSKGRFHYLRGTGISLDFTQPAGDRITMANDQFGITSSGKTSVVRLNSNPMLRQLQRMLTACMTGDISMLQEGSRLTYSDEGGNYVVTLTPDDRRAKNMIKLIVLTFEKENMSLAGLRMEEASGDVSQYRFFNKTFNAEIDPARFAIR